jgi:hypothetical protein
MRLTIIRGKISIKLVTMVTKNVVRAKNQVKLRQNQIKLLPKYINKDKFMRIKENSEAERTSLR